MTHTKFLGLVIDENLSWSFHIDSISRKIAKSMGILYRAQHYLNLDSLKNLYYSFIYSHISYGTLIWGSNYKSKLLPVHLLQKRAQRAITFTDRRTPSRPLFQRLDILNIFEIVKLRLSDLAYKHNTNHRVHTVMKSHEKSWNLKMDFPGLEKSWNLGKMTKVMEKS